MSGASEAVPGAPSLEAASEAVLGTVPGAPEAVLVAAVPEASEAVLELAAAPVALEALPGGCQGAGPSFGTSSLLLKVGCQIFCATPRLLKRATSGAGATSGAAIPGAAIPGATARSFSGRGTTAAIGCTTVGVVTAVTVGSFTVGCSVTVGFTVPAAEGCSPGCSGALNLLEGLGRASSAAVADKAAASDVKAAFTLASACDRARSFSGGAQGGCLGSATSVCFGCWLPRLLLAGGAPAGWCGTFRTLRAGSPSGSAGQPGGGRGRGCFFTAGSIFGFVGALSMASAADLVDVGLALVFVGEISMAASMAFSRLPA